MYIIKLAVLIFTLVAMALTLTDASHAQPAVTEEQIIKNISAISEKLTSETKNSNSFNKTAILKHLYEQIRPNVELTRKGVTNAEINTKTMQYVEAAYYPALTKNYIDLYNAMKKGNVNLTVCNNKDTVQPFMLRSLKATLCVKKSIGDNSWNVLYSAYDETKAVFKDTAKFIFSSDEMIGIDMLQADDVKYRISGL
jgi:glutamate synthase domain-containing protein 2